MWKHTKIMKPSCDSLLCDIGDFLPEDIPQETLEALHTELSFCSTIEGQIVFVADEIAQRSHDLDDALSAGLLSIDGLIDALSLKKLHVLKEKIESLRNNMAAAKNNHRIFIAPDALLFSSISSEVIHYFIDDVVSNFKSFLAKETEMDEASACFQVRPHVDRQLIQFSLQGQLLNEYLETIVAKQVINSAEVASFDDKAHRIIATLFDIYYENPRLLHDGTLQRIYIEMRKQTTNVIHFQEGDIGLVNEEWERIKNPENAPRFRDIRELFPDIDFSIYPNVQEFQKSLTDKEQSATVIAYMTKCVGEYTTKRKTLVLAICDFIAGMTDTYALKEYRKLVC